MVSSSRFLRYFTFVLVFAIPLFGQTGLTGDLDDLKGQITRAMRASEIAGTLRRAEKASTSSSETVSVLMHAHTVLQKRMANAVPNGEPDEAIAISDLYHNNAENLRKQLVKWIGQLEATAPAEFSLVKAKVELAQFHESYEPRRTGPKRVAEERKKMAVAQRLYSEAMALDNARGRRLSADSLAIRVLLADSYMKSADFEKALPLYEEYVEGVIKLEGPGSATRVRGLLSLAKIAELAGDRPRFDQLSKELNDLGISTGKEINISLRTDADSKGVDNPGAFIYVQPYIYVLNSPRMGIAYPGGPPLDRAETGHQTLTSRMFTGVPAIVSVDPSGTVNSIEVLSGEEKIKRSVELLVRKWKFRPLTYKGAPSSMRGVVYCWINN